MMLEATQGAESVSRIPLRAAAGTFIRAVGAAVCR